MRCPYCGSTNTQVKDSRPSEDHTTIRRRRICADCIGRFTTFERSTVIVGFPSPVGDARFPLPGVRPGSGPSG